MVGMSSSSFCTLRVPMAPVLPALGILQLGPVGWWFSQYASHQGLHLMDIVVEVQPPGGLQV